LLIKEKTIKLSNDEVADLARGRTFLSVQDIETLITANSDQKARGFFTIGVITEI